jgi:hypothetical protein
MEQWTTIWPQEKGWYWFHGKTYRMSKEKLHTVQVWVVTNGFSYIADGHFIYPEEAVGMWLPITTPEVPDVSQFAE